MDHIRELQGRLFSIAIAFVVVAATAYPFFDKIANIILAPLKKGQDLVYLTPGGAFSFIIKVCMYIGIVGVLPVIIFHVYRFVMPVVKGTTLRRVLVYTIFSALLAAVGIVFAYYVSLPASLYFLTSFNLYHINPMLTIDSYFSFVMTYLLAGALLFQLPIVMLIINTANRMKPKKLMNFQRHMIVGSFVVAAIISPTPDALNQVLLASPMVVMYQLGIIIIWIINRRAAKRDQKEVQEAQIVRTAAKLMPAAVVPVRATLSAQSATSSIFETDDEFEAALTALTQKSLQDNRVKASTLHRSVKKHTDMVCVPRVEISHTVSPSAVRVQKKKVATNRPSVSVSTLQSRRSATLSTGVRQSMDPIMRSTARRPFTTARPGGHHVPHVATSTTLMTSPVRTVRSIDGVMAVPRSTV